MTTYTLQGIHYRFDDTDTADLVSDATLTVVVAPGVTGFSYSYDDIPGGGEPTTVEVDGQGSDLYAYGLDGDFSDPENETTVVRLNWADTGGAARVTYLIAFDVLADGAGEYVFVIGGDALPSFGSPAAFQSFNDNQILGISDIPASHALAAGKTIPFATLPGVSSTEDDTIPGTGWDDTLLGGAGNDEIYGHGGSDSLSGGDGDDWIVVNADNDGTVVDGGEGFDDLVIDDMGTGASPALVVDYAGGAANDRLTVTGRSDHTATATSFYAVTGYDIERVSLAFDGDLLVLGDAEDNRIRFNEFPGVFELQGAGGTDQLDLHRTWVELEGGSRIRGVSSAFFNEATDLSGTAANLRIENSDGTGLIGVLKDWENIRFTDGVFSVADLLAADGGSTEPLNLLGTSGDDTLRGGAGDDNLAGLAGDDLLDGGDGSDRADYALVPGGVIVDLAAGTASEDGYGNTDTLVGIERVGGSGFDDRLSGNALANSFTGGLGDDTIDGRGGVDFVWYSEAGSAVQVDLRSGAVTGGAGNDLLSNIEGINGSAHDDYIFGSTADNILRGGSDGDDTLNGWSGDDTLDGGTGADLLIGGHGSDVIYVDNAGDRVSESRKWTGHDTVISSVDFRMGRKHIEDLELTGDARIGAGNGLANRITGNDGDNILDGGKNNDTLVGGHGHDTYLVRSPGDTVVEQAIGGSDTVKAYRSYALEANVEKLFMQTVYTKDGDPTQFNGIGNGLDNTIIGTPFANTIVGREGNDILKGQAGDDTFVFDRAIGPDNVDRIIDFEVNGDDDTLKFKASVLDGAVSAGTLAAGHFVAGTAAADANDRFIFDQGSGQLWFDADGSGAGDQVLVATFEQNAVVAADDILIF